MPKPAKPIVAIIYDFDGTLAPGNIQEHRFLKKLKIQPKAFWCKVKDISREHQADEILIYMYEMLKKASGNSLPVDKNTFKSHGKDLKFFNGVEEWFDRMARYAKKAGVILEHYLISSANEEIIAGTTIASKFKKIYASKFLFDENEVAVWPALAINYTTKTQFLFRINKGADDLSDHEKVNKFVEKQARRIPFEHMIYIGDGTTDVPCFRLIKELGGLSIAVYKPHTKGAEDQAEQYQRDGRVHSVVLADYSKDKKLDQLVKAALTAIATRHKLTSLWSGHSS